MLVFVRKGHELGLDGRTVARTDALDLTVVEWGVGQSAAERLVNITVGVACPARKLAQDALRRHEAELMEIRFTLLYLHVLEVNRASVDAYRRARLHPGGGYSVACYALGEMRYGRLGDASARHHAPSDVHEAVQECPGRDHDAACPQLGAPYRAHSGGAAVLNDELVGLVLPDVKPLRRVERRAPLPNELLAVALCPRAPHGRSLAAVEHAELDCRSVRYAAHLSAQRINLPYYLSFGYTAHGRIAAHLRNLVHVHRYQTRAGTHARCRRCRLASRVAAADDQYVVFHFHNSPAKILIKNDFYLKNFDLSLIYSNFAF